MKLRNSFWRKWWHTSAVPIKCLRLLHFLPLWEYKRCWDTCSVRSCWFINFFVSFAVGWDHPSNSGEKPNRSVFLVNNIINNIFISIVATKETIQVQTLQNSFWRFSLFWRCAAAASTAAARLKWKPAKLTLSRSDNSFNSTHFNLMCIESENQSYHKKIPFYLPEHQVPIVFDTCTLPPPPPPPPPPRHPTHPTQPMPLWHLWIGGGAEAGASSSDGRWLLASCTFQRFKKLHFSKS